MVGISNGFTFTYVIINHFFIYDIIVIDSVIYNIIIENPAEKVELPYGCLYVFAFIFVNKEGYTMVSPERIKVKLRIRF
jgi:hypothetical protein